MKSKLQLLPALMLAALLLWPQNANADKSQAPENDNELWTGSVYTSTFKIGFCRSGESVRGVVLLRTWTGKVDVYHFYGSMHDGIIEAAHSSGHKFKGSFVSNSEVKGKLKLKNGHTVEVKADRHHNANLNEDCRPVDK